MIVFNEPPILGTEIDYIKDVFARKKVSGDGIYTHKCCQWLEQKFSVSKVLLTTSGSSALDMAALLCDIKSGDEVILPSYTFSSTANSFAIYGAKLVFVDINPKTMNIDEYKIENAITERTKVICVVHYAGVSCNMDYIKKIAEKYNLIIVEDAAQGVMSKYKNKYLGTIGDFGCYSFHETKNYSMGEGGALLINSTNYIERAEIIREKGTNRSKYFRGQVAKYNWVDIGDSFLPSELNAAYLWAQLEQADKINNRRMEIWNKYNEAFYLMKEKNIVDLPCIPEQCIHNAHMYFLKCKDYETRQSFIEFMKQNNVLCAFHYVPLHSAPAGMKYGSFIGLDDFTTSESDKLVRLPIYYNMKDEDVEKVISLTLSFFSSFLPNMGSSL